MGAKHPYKGKYELLHLYLFKGYTTAKVTMLIICGDKGCIIVKFSRITPHIAFSKVVPQVLYEFIVCLFRLLLVLKYICV